MGEVRIAKVDIRCVLGCDLDLDVCSCGKTVNSSGATVQWRENLVLSGVKRWKEDFVIGEVPKVDDVSLVDGVFDGAFGGDGEEGLVMGEGVVVSSSLLDRFTKSYLGGIMVSLIFLEGLEEEAFVEAMEVEEK
nr:hypothetical protein [Tanacetum cinerariifolium]